MVPVVVVLGLAIAGIGLILPEKPTASEAGKALADQRNKAANDPPKVPTEEKTPAA